MNIRSAYIPKSKRGQKVAQAIRDAGFTVRNSDVMGNYLCNIDRTELFLMSLLRQIAYILDPERACYAETEAYKVANEIRDVGDYGPYSADIAELDALRVEDSWPIEGW